MCVCVCSFKLGWFQSRRVVSVQTLRSPWLLSFGTMHSGVSQVQHKFVSLNLPWAQTLLGDPWKTSPHQCCWILIKPSYRFPYFIYLLSNSNTNSHSLLPSSGSCYDCREYNYAAVENIDLFMLITKCLLEENNETAFSIVQQMWVFSVLYSHHMLSVEKGDMLF